MKLQNRVQALEGKAGNDAPRIIHLVGKASGQTEEQAIAEFGRTKPIGPEDGFIFLVGMSAADPSNL
jgi:hypothetical protein